MPDRTQTAGRPRKGLWGRAGNVTALPLLGTTQ